MLKSPSSTPITWSRWNQVSGMSPNEFFRRGNLRHVHVDKNGFTNRPILISNNRQKSICFQYKWFFEVDDYDYPINQREHLILVSSTHSKSKSQFPYTNFKSKEEKKESWVSWIPQKERLNSLLNLQIHSSLWAPPFPWYWAKEHSLDTNLTTIATKSLLKMHVAPFKLEP